MEKLQALKVMAQEVNIDPLPTTTAGAGKVQDVLSIVFVILGAIAVMMIVIGGIKYAGSQGDPQGTAKAKNTIIYAIIGLIVAILSTVLVNLALGVTT